MIVRSGLLSLALVPFPALGCGGDDGNGSSGSSSGAGGAGGATAGNGAASGAGGAGSGASGSTATGQAGAGGATAGAGGGTAAAPVMCGTATCPPPMGSRILRACCVDQATATCGTMLAFGGGACSEPVDPDPRCESVTATLGVIPSCCTDMNRCGISLAMFGMPGCLSLEEAAMIAAGDGGVPDGGATNPFMVDLPAPKACQ